MKMSAECSIEHLLSVEIISINLLKPDPKNARQHSDRQTAQIARSIQSFGFNVPLLIDHEDRVIAGHGRLLACKKMGWREIPAIRLEHLSEAQARAFAIADNRLTDNSSWDEEILARTLTDLSAMDLDFSIEDTGFTMGEVDLRIEGLSGGAEEEADLADQMPTHISPFPISQKGDLWHLGEHRILCANALESTSYDSLMQGDRAHLIFTDPPYNVKIDGHASGLGVTRHREFAMAAGEMSELEFTDFLTRACRLMALNSVSGSIHFICMDWRHAGELIAAGKQVYSELKNLCVWAKDNGGMGSLYRSQHELIFVFKHGKGPHRNNIELGKYGRYRTNVWKYPSANTLSKHGEEGNLLAMHPTVKPVALVADAILDCSARGDIVLDPFLGSGSSVLAAHKVGRICYGMELDPGYIDTAISRWQNWSGGQAYHAITGRSFNETAKGAVHVG